MSTLFGLIAFGAFVCACVSLVKPSLFNRFSKKPMTRKRSLTLFSSAFVVALIISAATSPSKPGTDNTVADNAAPAATVAYITDEGTSERAIETVVVSVLKEKTNMGEDRMRNVDDVDGTVLIEYNADSNLTNGLTRGAIWTDIIDIVKKLSTNEGIESITVNAYLPLVDQYGNEAPGKVMTVNLTRETWSKINWDNFNEDNLPKIADFYFVHPAINN